MAHKRMICPECYETANRLDTPLPATGPMIPVEVIRRQHAHRDGTPLCPIMTKDGYRPALPIGPYPCNPEDL